MRHIANISWGKDSLAMLLMMIETGERLDEVVFYNTGMEFEAIYRERDRFLPLLESHGVAYTELKPKSPMWYDMLARPVKSSKNGEHNGYGWCGGACRWGTSKKTAALDSHGRDAVIYVAIAADEAHRVPSDPKNKEYPLIEWGMTEADCLAYCYENGAQWDEGGVRLYDILDRVSCWCCRNKNQKELRAIHDHLPHYWEMLNGLEQTLGTMKRKPLPEIAMVNQLRIEVDE